MESGGKADGATDIVIVDDDEDTRNLIAQMLKWRYPTFYITTIKDGKETFEFIQKKEIPALVLTDYEMPRMNGDELRKNIKNVYGSRVNVVLVTADATCHFLKDKFDGLLEKPINLNKLYAIVDHLKIGDSPVNLVDACNPNPGQ